MYEVKNVIDEQGINALGSALTIEGMAEESFDDYLDYIDETAGLYKRVIHLIKGEVMNKAYRLTGSNAYPNDLNIVCIDLEDVNNIGKLIFERFNFGGRWLDDVVMNNVWREEE